MVFRVAPGIIRAATTPIFTTMVASMLAAAFATVLDAVLAAIFTAALAAVITRPTMVVTMVMFVGLPPVFIPIKHLLNTLVNGKLTLYRVYCVAF